MEKWRECAVAMREKELFSLISIAYLSHYYRIAAFVIVFFLFLSFFSRFVAVLRNQLLHCFHTHTHTRPLTHINRSDCVRFYFDTYCIHIISILYGVDDDNIDNDNNGSCAYNMLELFEVDLYTNPHRVSGCV